MSDFSSNKDVRCEIAKSRFSKFTARPRSQSLIHTGFMMLVYQVNRYPDVHVIHETCQSKVFCRKIDQSKRLFDNGGEISAM